MERKERWVKMGKIKVILSQLGLDVLQKLSEAWSGANEALGKPEQ